VPRRAQRAVNPENVTTLLEAWIRSVGGEARFLSADQRSSSQLSHSLDCESTKLVPPAGRGPHEAARLEAEVARLVGRRLEVTMITRAATVGKVVDFEKRRELL